jgi:hypothetical protein
VFWIGLYPGAFLSRIEPSIERLLDTVHAKQTVDTGARPGLAEVKVEHPAP